LRSKGNANSASHHLPRQVDPRGGQRGRAHEVFVDRPGGAAALDVDGGRIFACLATVQPRFVESQPIE